MNCMVYKMETRIPRDTTNDCMSLIYVYYTFYICMYMYRYSNMIGCTWNTIFQKKMQYIGGIDLMAQGVGSTMELVLELVGC